MLRVWSCPLLLAVLFSICQVQALDPKQLDVCKRSWEESVKYADSLDLAKLDHFDPAKREDLRLAHNYIESEVIAKRLPLSIPVIDFARKINKRASEFADKWCPHLKGDAVFHRQNKKFFGNVHSSFITVKEATEGTVLRVLMTHLAAAANNLRGCVAKMYLAHDEVQKAADKGAVKEDTREWAEKFEQLTQSNDWSGAMRARYRQRHDICQFFGPGTWISFSPPGWFLISLYYKSASEEAGEVLKSQSQEVQSLYQAREETGKTPNKERPIQQYRIYTDEIVPPITLPEKKVLLSTSGDSFLSDYGRRLKARLAVTIRKKAEFEMELADPATPIERAILLRKKIIPEVVQSIAEKQAHLRKEESDVENSIGTYERIALVGQDSLQLEAGAMVYNVRPESKFYKQSQDLLKQVAAGPSGTSTLMMFAFDLLGFADTADRKLNAYNFQKCLLAWMINCRDHSYHEIMLALDVYPLFNRRYSYQLKRFSADQVYDNILDDLEAEGLLDKKMIGCRPTHIAAQHLFADNDKCLKRLSYPQYASAILEAHFTVAYLSPPPALKKVFDSKYLHVLAIPKGQRFYYRSFVSSGKYTPWKVSKYAADVPYLSFDSQSPVLSRMTSLSSNSHSGLSSPLPPSASLPIPHPQIASEMEILKSIMILDIPNSFTPRKKMIQFIRWLERMGKDDELYPSLHPLELNAVDIDRQSRPLESEAALDPVLHLEPSDSDSEFSEEEDDGLPLSSSFSIRSDNAEVPRITLRPPTSPRSTPDPANAHETVGSPFSAARGLAPDSAEFFTPKSDLHSKEAKKEDKAEKKADKKAEDKAEEEDRFKLKVEPEAPAKRVSFGTVLNGAELSEDEEILRLDQDFDENLGEDKFFDVIEAEAPTPISHKERLKNLLAHNPRPHIPEERSEQGVQASGLEEVEEEEEHEDEDDEDDDLPMVRTMDGVVSKKVGQFLSRGMEGMDVDGRRQRTHRASSPDMLFGNDDEFLYSTKTLTRFTKAFCGVLAKVMRFSKDSYFLAGFKLWYMPAGTASWPIVLCSETKHVSRVNVKSVVVK